MVSGQHRFLQHGQGRAWLCIEHLCVAGSGRRGCQYSLASHCNPIMMRYCLYIIDCKGKSQCMQNHTSTMGRAGSRCKVLPLLQGSIENPPSKAYKNRFHHGTHLEFQNIVHSPLAHALHSHGTWLYVFSLQRWSASPQLLRRHPFPHIPRVPGSVSATLSLYTALSLWDV